MCDWKCTMLQYFNPAYSVILKPYLYTHVPYVLYIDDMSIEQ